MRAAFILAASLAFPFALAIGCSLAVDTGGLSGGADGTDATAAIDATSDTSTGDGAPTTDAAGTDAADAGDARDAAGACPSGRGPVMVRVTDDHGSFCVDTTEVTQAQYDAFLSDNAARPTPPSVCKYRAGYTSVMRPANDLPVVNVDWCEAWMFCAWSGKRLCGSRDGTVINDYPLSNNPAKSEWYTACSHSDGMKYPYGNTSVAGACNGCDRTGPCTDGGAGPLLPVHSLATCEGGYTGLFDMVGNVSEWVDECAIEGSSGDNDECPPRGGDTSLASGNTKCPLTELPRFKLRKDANALSGIRCCAN